MVDKVSDAFRSNDQLQAVVGSDTYMYIVLSTIIFITRLSSYYSIYIASLHV